MGGLGSGGKNKTHTTVEDFRRLDSIALYNYLDTDEYIQYKDTVSYPSAISPEVVFHVHERTMEIKTGAYYSPLRFSKLPGVNGNGVRVFFECPHCGRRSRYLYKNKGDYMCRKCLGGNYRIQQRRGKRKLLLQMAAIIEKDLGYTHWRAENPGIGIQDLDDIPRPPYMRHERYLELLEEYGRLQDQYAALLLQSAFGQIPIEVIALCN